MSFILDRKINRKIKRETRSPTAMVKTVKVEEVGSRYLQLYPTIEPFAILPACLFPSFLDHLFKASRSCLRVRVRVIPTGSKTQTADGIISCLFLIPK